MGVSAVVDGYNDYLKKVGNMAKATQDSHSAIASLGSIGLKGLTIGLGAAAAGVTAIGVAAVGATTAITKMAVSLALDTAPLADTEQAFYRLAEARGQSGADILAQMQAETAGTISNIDLIAIYNKGIALMGENFMDVIPLMGEIVAQGAALGREPTDAIADFTLGVGRNSRMILDNLGIIVDLEGAQKAYAATLGKEVTALTETEQQTALLMAATDRLTKTANDLPQIAETSAGAFAILRAQFANTKFEIGKVLLPTLVDFVKQLTGGLGTALPEIVQIVKTEFLPYFANLGTTLGTILPRAIRWGITAFQFFLRLIGRVGNFMTTFIVPTFEFFGKVLDVVWPFVEKVTTWVGNLFSTLADAGPISLEFNEAIGGIIPTSLIEAFYTLKERVLEWYGLARTWWEEHAPKFKQAFIDIRDYIVNEFIPQALDWLQTKFQPIIDGFGSIWDAFVEDIPLILQEWDKIKERAVSVFEERIPAALSYLSEAWDYLAIAIGKALDWIGLKWSEHGDGIIGVISKIIQFGIEALGVAIELLAAAVTLALATISGDFERAKEIIDEIGATIEDFWQGIFGKQEGEEGILPPEWLDSLLQWGEDVRKFFGIESPSKFMAEIGQNIVKGFEKGLAVGSSPISAALAPAPASVVAGAGPVSNFNLTVNTAAPREPIIGDFRMLAALSRR